MKGELRNCGDIVAFGDGPRIKRIEIKKNKIIIDCISKDESIQVTLLDNGGLCCEDRYFTCDDNLDSHFNEKLKFICLNKIDEISEKYEAHDLAFLQIQTNKDFFTVCAHNVHNGYYGGFGIEVIIQTICDS